MAKSIEISKTDMHEFLTARRFVPVTVEGTKELVYGRIVRKDTCLRVYTSIVGETSRGNGEDAIRVCLVQKTPDGIKGLGSKTRVHRVEGWRKNLEARLDGWEEMCGPTCACGRPMAQRRSKRGKFWGCTGYPVCRQIVSGS